MSCVGVVGAECSRLSRRAFPRRKTSWSAREKCCETSFARSVLPSRTRNCACRYRTITSAAFVHSAKSSSLSSSSSLDLHTRNLAFTIPSLQALREEDFLRKLGRPETGTVQRTDGQPLGPGLPRYLVRPTSYHQDIETSFGPIKIIDFGQSFLRNEPPPDTLHTPFPYRAPEIIFRDKVDYRVDLWSMACLVRKRLQASRVYPLPPRDFHS